ENAGETEVPEQSLERLDKEPEVKTEGQAVNEIDWENYLDNYTMAPPMPAYRQQSDELPSLEATLTKRPSLFDHLAWQLKLALLNDEEMNFGLIVLGNLDSDGYLRDPPLEEIAADTAIDLETAEEVIKVIQVLDPVGCGSRTLEECLLVQAEHIGIDDDLVLQIIKVHLANLEKKNYGAIARDPKEPPEDIYEAAKVG